MLVNIHTHYPSSNEITISTRGIHPWESSHPLPEDFEDRIRGIDAIGECGLDGACKKDDSLQEEVFRFQLSMAEKHQLPVVIHCVRRFERVMVILSEYNIPDVIFHGFTGNVKQMREALQRGYYLSFGERNFSSEKTIEVLRAIPLESIFIETDEVKEPVEIVYLKACRVKECSLETLSTACTNNFNKIFRR